MFDMSWGEIMVIGGVALIVIGPKDLPKALRTVGQMTAKVRRMAGEFQSQFSEAMREAELEDVRKEVEGLNRDVTAATSSSFNPIQTIRDEFRGSIDGASATGSSTATASTAALGGLSADPGAAATADALVETGPVPHIVPAATEPAATGAVLPPGAPSPDLPAHHALDPETAPLVPLPADEPVLLNPDPSRVVTGPGLEPVKETEMPEAARPAGTGAAASHHATEVRA